MTNPKTQEGGVLTEAEISAHFSAQTGFSLEDSEYALLDFARAIESAVLARVAPELSDLRKKAQRYEWLTKHAFVGVCYTDEVESGEILEIMGCDRCVPDEVGECSDVGEAIDAAIEKEKSNG